MSKYLHDSVSRSLLLSLFVLTLCGQPARAVEVGDAMPDFALPDLLTGGVVHGAGVARGKWLYLDFWASWCGPCRVSLPAMSKIYTEYRERGFEVLAINVDADSDAGRKFLASTPVSFPALADPHGDVAASYELLGMPTSYLIDPDGKVAWVHQGFRRGDAAKVRARLDAVLAVASPPAPAEASTPVPSP